MICLKRRQITIALALLWVMSFLIPTGTAVAAPAVPEPASSHANGSKTRRLPPVGCTLHAVLGVFWACRTRWLKQEITAHLTNFTCNSTLGNDKKHNH
jgi:hypothetical protein